MNSARFDVLARNIAPSRRAVMGAFVGASLVALVRVVPTPTDVAGNRDQGKPQRGKKRCGRRPIDTQNDPLHCGALRHACGAGELCIRGVCVPGRGTCLTGNDVCLGTLSVVGCNGNTTCDCATRFVGNQLVCGGAKFCGVPCTADADCIAAGQGVFCARKTGTNCCVGSPIGEGFCMGFCQT